MRQRQLPLITAFLADAEGRVFRVDHIGGAGNFNINSQTAALCASVNTIIIHANAELSAIVRALASIMS